MYVCVAVQRVDVQTRTGRKVYRFGQPIGVRGGERKVRGAVCLCDSAGRTIRRLRENGSWR